MVSTTSSGRLSSSHILSKDELENYIFVFYIVILYYHDILREDKLITNPQGGWAGELFSVLLLVHLYARHYWYGSKAKWPHCVLLFLFAKIVTPQSARGCGFAEIIPPCGGGGSESKCYAPQGGYGRGAWCPNKWNISSRIYTPMG